MTRKGRALRVAALALLVLVVLVVSLVRPDIPVAELTDAYGGGASRFLEVQGMRVHYRDEGSGPPLILIHGTASSLHTWDGWVRELSAKRRIVRMDLPGFGLTGPAPDRDYSVARYARLVAEVLDRLGIDRADIAGSSLGGRVAATLALDHRSRVRRVVLIDPAGLRGHVPPAVFRLARVPVLNVLLEKITPRALIRRNVEDVYGDPARVTNDLVDRYWRLTRREGNRTALVDRLSGPVDPDLDDRLGEIDVPVLIQWGERDRWIPPSFAQRFHAGIRGASLVTYPDAGHVPMEEMPEATSRDAESFLARAD